MDDELENLLADIEDVASGRIIDQEHAEFMEPLTEVVSELEDELQDFYTTSTRNAVVNNMSVDELKKFIATLKCMTDSIRKMKESAI
jgi:hypothetical protein